MTAVTHDEMVNFVPNLIAKADIKTIREWFSTRRPHKQQLTSMLGHAIGRNRLDVAKMLVEDFRVHPRATAHSYGDVPDNIFEDRDLTETALYLRQKSVEFPMQPIEWRWHSDEWLAKKYNTRKKVNSPS
jgi:hypothetical protein